MSCVQCGGELNTDGRCKAWWNSCPSNPKLTFSELVGAMSEAGELIEPMEREQRIRDLREAVIKAAKAWAHAMIGTREVHDLYNAVRALEEAEG